MMIRPAIALLVTMLVLTVSGPLRADSKQEIDRDVDAALERFTREVTGGDTYLASAKGVLVFPSVFKAGFIVGGEYGEGALRVDGKTVDYYNTVAGSVGLQIGAQTKAIYILFMDTGELKKFRGSYGWEAGVDGSINLISVGAGGSFNTDNAKDPIIGFVLTNHGLMYNLTLEGTKFTKLDK